MRHFHVIRWHSVGLSTGERISVPDVDYASVASRREAEHLVAATKAIGERCASYECTDGCCTMHQPRVGAEAAAVALTA